MAPVGRAEDDGHKGGDGDGDRASGRLELAPNGQVGGLNDVGGVPMAEIRVGDRSVTMSGMSTLAPNSRRTAR